jgi:hypothetical protein
MAAAVASLPPARSGMASGLVNTSRMVGTTLDVAVLAALFAVHAGDSRPEAMVGGLRLAYLGGAFIALVFIRGDAIAQKAD